MKAVMLDENFLNRGDLSWEKMRQIEGLDFEVYEEVPVDQIPVVCADADILLCNHTDITREIIDSLPKLKYIAKVATGYNDIDIAAAKERGIPVSNTPGYGTMSVAQYTMALILEICHHVWAHNTALHEKDWDHTEQFCFWNYKLIELNGKTLGIVGFGQIGAQVAKMAQSFGMKILVYTRTPKPELESETLHFVSFGELLERSDFISLHIPAFESTRGMICKESIAKMKDGVYLINTARGVLINEQDLADALNSGKIAGAALDVLTDEPPRNDNPLLHAKNCIITAHIAWATPEARLNMLEIATDNVARYMKGELVNIVNG